MTQPTFLKNIEQSVNPDAPLVKVNDPLFVLPPAGFFFIVKSDDSDVIPVVFIALQKDGTEDTVSIRVNPQEARFTVEALNVIQQQLVTAWYEEFGAPMKEKGDLMGCTSAASVPFPPDGGEFV
jgi:hypothetical protein